MEESAFPVRQNPDFSMINSGQAHQCHTETPAND